MKVEKVQGIAIMVKDMDEAAKFFADVLGTEFGSPYVVFGAIHRQSPLGITLLAPPMPDGAAARTLENRGEGLNTLILKVPNVAEAAAEMKSRGIRQVIEGGGAVFFHPKDCHGVLIRLAGQE